MDEEKEYSKDSGCEATEGCISSGAESDPLICREHESKTANHANQRSH